MRVSHYVAPMTRNRVVVSGLENLTKPVVGSNPTHPTFCHKTPKIHNLSKMYSSQNV